MAPQTAKPVVDLTARCACGAVTVTVRGRVTFDVHVLVRGLPEAPPAPAIRQPSLPAPGDVTVTGRPAGFARPANSGATFTR